MGKVLVIGAGGVGTVVVHKMASLPDVFTEIRTGFRQLRLMRTTYLSLLNL